MRVGQLVNVLILIALFEKIFSKESSLNRTTSTAINQSQYAQKINQLKNIKKSDTQFIEKESTANQNNKLRSENFMAQKIDSNDIQLINRLSNIDTSNLNINNITSKFSCFYFNIEDFSVYDLSQLDKQEYT
jgi:hypothetical protein